MRILITESQLKYLIVEAQKIKVINECGVTKEYDYAQWWYNGGQKQASYTYSYTWDGTKNAYVFDFKKDPEYKTLTQSQRDYKLRTKCSGSYKEQPNLISAAVKDIKSFASWKPSDNLQATIDWLLWFVKWLGPQGQALAKIVETIQAIAYMFASLFKETTKERVSLFIEGLSKFLSLANFNIKVPGLSDWIDKITSFLDKYGFSSVIAKLKSQGKNINDRFDRQPKWIQAVVTLIVQAVGTAVSTIFTWINTNLLTPFYNLIISYNTTVGGYLKTIIDYLAIFASMIDTAKIIIDDPDTKGILNLGK
jgi:hypothetical protein